MPSRGVQCYSYIAVPGCQIDFSVPQQTITKNVLRVFGNDHLEVDKKNIKGVFNFTGTFSFRVLQNGNQLTYQSVNINILTGTNEAGTMKDMVNQLSIVNPDVIVSYGFYDAGPGVAGLPNSDQCYVAVTPNYSNWMSQVAPPNSPQSSQPFSRFSLPAAHDVGMNIMQTSEALLQSTALVNVLTRIIPVFGKIAGMMSHDAVAAIAPNIIYGLAITQKDTLPTMLSIGARYFEFRPAYLHSAVRGTPTIPDVLYFSHSAIPGMPYSQFLFDCVSFLSSHPDEIIVFQLRWDGVPAECARPSDADMQSYISNALSSINGSITAGNLNDMLTQSISALRSQNKRLIWFTPVDSFSTYTDAGNATLHPSTLIAQFEAITPASQAGKPFTNLQCQATATNIPDVVAYSVLTANTSSSCLMATKPICDSSTLPWIKNNGMSRLDRGQLVVVMNDFLDGATADVCVELSRARLMN